MTLDELKTRMGWDYFLLLGLPHRYTIDPELMKKNYLAMSRAAHPDFFAAEPQKMAEAMAVSAGVNEAYRTLQDPVRRAEYVLLAHGGKDAGQDKRVPADMLGEVLMWNEEVEEAKESGDAATLAGFKEGMEERHAAVLGRIEGLAATLTEREANAREDQETLDALRRELNAMKYVQNLLGQL